MGHQHSGKRRWWAHIEIKEGAFYTQLFISRECKWIPHMSLSLPADPLFSCGERKQCSVPHPWWSPHWLSALWMDNLFNSAWEPAFPEPSHLDAPPFSWWVVGCPAVNHLPSKLSPFSFQGKGYSGRLSTLASRVFLTEGGTGSFPSSPASHSCVGS